MRGRFVLMVALALAGSAVIARAGGGGDAPAGATSAAEALRLPVRHCVARDRHVRLSFVPPAGQSFAVLSVRAGGVEVLQLSGLAGPATVAVMLPRGAARVRVSATTSAGDFLYAAQTYPRCREVARPPAREPTPPAEGGPVLQGGGED